MITRLLCLLWIAVTSVTAVEELKLVHVLFTHKSYAPVSRPSELYAGFPQPLTYDHFGTGAIEMPKVGKVNMYNLGVHLRAQYGEFLGPVFTDEIMKMRTSEYALSMLSAQLVNAGLWPPAGDQKWNRNMDWQPIPTEYVPKHEDTLLLGTNCPAFKTEKELVLRTDHVRRTIKSFSKLFDTFANHAGISVNSPSEVALLYNALETKAELDEELPYWAYDIFPHGAMYNVTLLEYELLTHSPLQRMLNGGTMLKEIIGNCLKHIRGALPKGRKMMLYSGDEKNIASVLKTLNIWFPHIPKEASALIFELTRDTETDKYGIRVKYYTGVDGDTIPLTLPTCTEVCPLRTFLTMYFNTLPQREVLLCNWKYPLMIDNEIERDFKGTESRSSVQNPEIAIILSSVLLVQLLMYTFR